ncbi:hypothetical protein F8160_00070 [Bacillus sp. CH126_4D]|uniref:hypothetical protein n=1 Tax=unclassified Bacillus (in: firmicutes) TaxID=185979 RepID=UPI00124CD8FC|nr:MULTISPECIES: hypothetical protein [unclassified Bacillus (in: firmicutes)]KAB2460768.1 hypothetical protein F8162_00735 [Bacillus sp. CH140a_4T]KAB2476412.1 hypothetical protein F8160_00070 [Bacillus sp. CH126_4D]
MKKLWKTLLAAFVLSSGLLFGTSDAFAMGSKGHSNLTLSTDANNYGRGATSIDVSVSTTAGNIVVELYKKGNNNPVARRDAYFGVNGGRTTVKFYTSGLTSGQYDVVATGSWGDRTYRRELTSYINVTR